MSQLDLAIAADVSSRHISFLETGRSRPSAEMVLRLCATLGVPLRHVNTMLRAVGHDAAYDDARDALPETAQRAIDLMKSHQEPYPLIVMDRDYTVRDLNQAAQSLLSVLFAGGDAAVAMGTGLSLARFTFDPLGAHSHIVNIDEVGRDLLWRLQRQVLQDPDDGPLREVLDEILAMPTVESDWRAIDLSVPADPALVVPLRLGDVELRFLTDATAFQAPQHATVEDLAIEAWFPVDDATADVMRGLADAG